MLSDGASTSDLLVLFKTTLMCFCMFSLFRLMKELPNKLCYRVSSRIVISGKGNLFCICAKRLATMVIWIIPDESGNEKQLRLTLFALLSCVFWDLLSKHRVIILL